MSAKRRGIGGSDLAAVCAYYKPERAEDWAHWATAADVWMRLVHDVERPRTDAMQRGLDAEPRLRRVWLDTFGGELEEHPRPWIERHPRFPFVSASPDDVWLNDGERVYVEWKTRNKFAEQKRPMFGPPGTDEAPAAYALQVQLNLDILGLERGVLFVGFGCETKDETGAKPFLYSHTAPYFINRDTKTLEWALGYAERFFADHVHTRTPPSVEPRNNIREWKRLLKEQSWKTEAASPSST
jgi:predicted phage-related endonuclease